MTAADIIAKLFSAKGVTPPRILKAQALASRSQIAWADVLAAMTDSQRQQVTDAR